MAKKKGPRARTSASRLAVLRRREFVLEMRFSGAHYRDIASAAIKEFGRENLPVGWDERYAYKDLQRYLAQTSAEYEEGRDTLRRLEIERLDSMQKSVWDDATSGDKSAISSVLSIMNRRDRLAGVDAPIEFTVDDIRGIARDVVAIISREVEDEAVRERIFDALGFTAI